MKICGHRGAKDELPENTLKGIQFAIDCGVAAIEIDVHLTKDNQIVVIHDPTVDRTTDGTGKVVDFTLDEIQSFNAGEGEAVPTLSDVIKLVKKAGIEIQIEIKAPEVIEKVVEEIKKNDLYNSAAVICFNHRALQIVKKLDPKIVTICLMVAIPVDPVAIAKSCGAQGFSLNISTVDKQMVDECHSAGLFIGVWTVNEFQQVDYFKNMGVDYLATDKPSEILKN